MKLRELFAGTFKAATYREVRQAGDFFLGYAMLIVAITTFAVTVYYTIFIHRELFTAQDGKPAMFDDAVNQIATQVPPMVLQDHQLMSNDPTPSVIKISGSAFGEDFNDIELITIDTSGQTTHENMETPILVSSKDIIFKTSDKTEIKSIAEITKDMPSTLIINRAMIDDVASGTIEAVHQGLLTFYLFLGAASWFFIAVYMAVMRLCMLLALGLVGLAIGSLTKSPITYTAAVGLAAVSYVPIAILDTILFAALHYPTSSVIMFAAGSVALFAAIKCSNTPAPRELVG